MGWSPFVLGALFIPPRDVACQGPKVLFEASTEFTDKKKLISSGFPAFVFCFLIPTLMFVNDVFAGVK